jgi:hypothetical protein
MPKIPCEVCASTYNVHLDPITDMYLCEACYNIVHGKS